MTSSVLALLCLLCLVPAVTGQGDVNLTVGEFDLTTDNLEDTDGDGSCLCQGDRGALKSDHALAWLPTEYLEANGLLPNVTCGDVEAKYSDNCSDVFWMSMCCTQGAPYYQCSNNVRSQLLAGYDKISPPIFQETVNVTAEMIYHTVTAIQEASGVIEILVWLTLRWNDPRLAWEYDPSADGPCTALPVNFRAEEQNGLKDSEIWVPEFDLMNQVSGVGGLKGVLGVVTNNGDVTWFRQGQLKAICQMENLGSMPWDSMGCQLLMGSKSLGVVYQLYPAGGLKVSDYAGPYNGYQLTHAEPGVAVFDYGEQFLFFNFGFSRGTVFYSQNIIVPVAIFSYCSLLTMLVGVGAFQTLALNFTLLLVTVTQKISSARLLPLTSEPLWLVDFVSGSFYFVVFTLAVTFLKFIIIQMREERQLPQSRTAGKDPEGGDEENTEEESSSTWLPDWFFTFPLRKMDVICSVGGIIAYTIYIIVFSATKDSYGGGVPIKIFYNATGTSINSEL